MAKTKSAPLKKREGKSGPFLLFAFFFLFLFLFLALVIAVVCCDATRSAIPNPPLLALAVRLARLCVTPHETPGGWSFVKEEHFF